MNAFGLGRAIDAPEDGVIREQTPSDKPIGYGLYLIGPVIEGDGGEAYFVMAFGGPRSFTMDFMPGSSGEEASDGRATMVKWATNHSIGGVETFDDEHALPKRAVEVWPNRKTRQALAEFEEPMALAERLNAAGVTPDGVLH